MIGSHRVPLAKDGACPRPRLQKGPSARGGLEAVQIRHPAVRTSKSVLNAKYCGSLSLSLTRLACKPPSPSEYLVGYNIDIKYKSTS